MKERILKNLIILLLMMPLALMFHDSIGVQLLGGAYVFLMAWLLGKRQKRYG